MQIIYCNLVPVPFSSASLINRIYYRSPIQTEKSQLEGKRIMLKTRFTRYTSFPHYSLTRGLGFLGLHRRLMTDYCLACEAKARHRYCFSRVVVIVVVVVGGGINFVEFCVKVFFSETIRARAMKPGSCVQLKATINTKPSPTFYGSLTL